MANIIIATTNDIFNNLPKNLTNSTVCNFYLINKKEDLDISNIKALEPTYIFFPHWSYIITPEIFDNFECIIFHMTDVPFGRGGSPLQNLIVRGIYETKISAIRCVKDIDAGPVYLKRPLSLNGSAEEIFLRASKIIEEMIIAIIENEIEPLPQQGEPTFFTRRTPDDSDISGLNELIKVFDHIRMLDAKGYPNAFIETDHLRLDFTDADLKDDQLIAKVKFTKK